MAILVFDTSSQFLSVAVATREDVFAIHESVGHAHAERLIPSIQRLLAEAGTSLNTLDAIAFGVGPGAFTGLRIACGVAQGLAFASDRPLIAIGAFEAVAAAAVVRAARASVADVRVAIDARMSEVYTALVARQDGRWCIVGTPALAAPGDVPPDGELGAGTGFGVFAPLAAQRNGPVFPDVVPEARTMVDLARAALARGESLDPADAAPVYLRDRVALTTIERRARAAQ